jgi:hypothetical protein
MTWINAGTAINQFIGRVKAFTKIMVNTNFTLAKPMIKRG